MDMAAASFHLPLTLSSSSSYYSLLHPLLSSQPPPPPSPSRSSCFCRCSSSSHLHLHRSALSPAANKTLTHIKNSGVIACLRAQSSELALEAARAALSGGISVLEIVMSTPGVFEVLQQLVQDCPATTIGDEVSPHDWMKSRSHIRNHGCGCLCLLSNTTEEGLDSYFEVGTVLNAVDAKNAINAGAKFLMSPAIVMDILDHVQGSEALYIPGAMTPTEILTAYNAGAKIVKVYPVSAMGGSQYITTLKKPFSHIQMVASQGIKIDLIGEYIAEGASAVVLSDAIFDKEAMAQRNFNAISRLAHLAALQSNVAVERKRRFDAS